MAVFRFLHTEFWKDDFFIELTPEDKYFYIYLLTNDRCTQCGIYKLGIRFAALELGYSIDTVKTLVERFIKYGKILYNEKNGEIMILNWYKYNITINNKNTRACVNNCLKNIKSLEFIGILYSLCTKKFAGSISLVEDMFKEINFNTNILQEDISGQKACSNNEGMEFSSSVEAGLGQVDDFSGEFEQQGGFSEKLQDADYCDMELGRGAYSQGNHENSTLNKVVEVFQNNFHLITPIELEKLSDWCGDITPEVVIKGIEVATLNNKRSVKYLNGILRNWYENGIKNIEDYDNWVKASEKDREKKKSEPTLPQYKVLPNDKYEDEEAF